jgi:sigma-54 dependent transcriptional regulator, acetoin dehydrogenase operon transcriptional activator AcoR
MGAMSMESEIRTIHSADKLNLMRSALDMVREGILMVDADGIVKGGNKPFFEVLGRSEEHIKGRPVSDVFPYLKEESVSEKRLCSGVLATTTGDVEYDMEIMPVSKGMKSIGAVLRLFSIRPKLKLRRRDDEGQEVVHDGLIAASHASRKAIHIAKITSKSRSNILLQGETGTGKEEFAGFIHRHSKRRDGPFVAINCAAIPLQLAESELFGYVSGAFTGASPRGRKGKFELADGGTLFLDEINSLNPEIQKKLLRVLETREITPLGGRGGLKINTRIMAASSTELREEVLVARFLPELLYRINAITINIPPLRERKEDIRFLSEHFLRKLQLDHEKTVLGIDPEALLMLESYDWPGNIRELRNAVEYALALTQDRMVTVDDLPEQVNTHSKKTAILGLRAVNRLSERQVISNAIDSAKGNMTQAARALGISRSTLYRKIRKHDISA